MAAGSETSTAQGSVKLIQIMNEERDVW